MRSKVLDMTSKLRKIRLGDFVELVDIRNKANTFTVDDLCGISIKKILTPTKADTNNLDVTNYKIVKKGWFTYSLVTSRNGNKISIAYNDSKDCIVSQINPVFRIRNENELHPRYLMMFFNRVEFDRYSRFNSWGSARETFDWNEMCAIELEIPPIDIQRKYVAIYESLLSNLDSYQNNLDDFKTACDLSIESFKRMFPMKPLNTFASLIDERNKENEFRNVYGLTVYKKFIETKADLRNVLLTNYKIVRKGDIAFVPTTNRNGDKIACGLCEEDCIVSQIYEVMRLDKTKVVPGYVFMWFLRTEMDRFARYNSWGSARENISWEDLGSYQIPVPPIETQINIMKLNEIFYRRKKYIDELKVVINKICPILIRGSILEAKGEKQNAN